MADMICLMCSKPLKGRSDKRFCDDFCRNQHHNVLKGRENNLIRKVNNALMKNRRILKDLYEEIPPPHQISRTELMLEGFVFRYHTHKQFGPSEILMCYDYGVSVSDEDCFIVRDEKTMRDKRKSRRPEIST